MQCQRQIQAACGGGAGTADAPFLAGTAPGKRARLLPHAWAGSDSAAATAVTPTDAAALADAASPGAPLLLDPSDAVPAAMAYARASLRPFTSLPEHVGTVGRAVAGIALLAQPLTPAQTGDATSDRPSAARASAAATDLFSDEARSATADA